MSHLICVTITISFYISLKESEFQDQDEFGKLVPRHQSPDQRGSRSTWRSCGQSFSSFQTSPERDPCQNRTDSEVINFYSFYNCHIVIVQLKFKGFIGSMF